MADIINNMLTPEQLLTSDRVRGLLRDIDIEAADAFIAAATVATCVRSYTATTVPITSGAEAVVLSDTECEILTHHAHSAEAASRRVSNAIHTAAATAKGLPTTTASIATFDPILGQIERYKRLRGMMEGDNVSDQEAADLHAEGISPFSQDTPPVVRSIRGAAEAIRLVLSFDDVDTVDANIMRGVLAFLDQRS